LAGAGHTQPIRMEETYTATTVKPAKKVIWDSQFQTFFVLIQGFMVEIHTLLYAGTHEDKNKARMLVEEYI
jgi:hypothetical protein